MSNVIQVEFGKKKTVTELTDDLFSKFGLTPELNVYITDLLDGGLDEDDADAIIDAINDVNVYLESDEVIQELADGWLHQFL